MPRASTKLISTLVPLTVRSTAIGLTLSCIPMNQPLKAIRLRVAGAAHIRMKKYFEASSRTSGVHSMTRKAALTNTHWMRISSRAQARAIPNDLANMRAHSLRSPLPNAWAVSPPVPTLRKPKFQYSRSKSIVPIAMPPMSVAAFASRCPATAMSTIPTSGTVMFARMLGIASLSISLLIAFIICICPPPQAFPDKKNSGHSLCLLPQLLPSPRSPARGCGYKE